jgi:hypothetical protein
MVGPSLAPTPTPQIVSEHKFHKFRSWRDAGNENVTKDEVEIEHLSVTSSTIEGATRAVLTISTAAQKRATWHLI